MRISHLPPAALLAHLERRLPLLTGGPRDLLAHQQTLRGAIAWSYDLLDEEEQRIFRSLAVFSGGCALEAAETVIGGQILDGIGALVDQSLLRQQEQAEPADAEPRFAMLEMIREYADERLVASGEAEALHRQHADYYLALAQASPPRVAPWDRLEREHDNLRAALDWFVARGPAVSALQLAQALGQFWRVRGHLAEGRARLARVLALPEAAECTATNAWVRFWHGVLLLEAGVDDAAARASFTDALEMREALGDRRGVARTLWQLARVEERRDDDAAAHVLYVRSLAIFREIAAPQDYDAATLLTMFGRHTAVRGDLPTARLLLEESLARYGDSGLRRMPGFALCFLGSVACDEGHFVEARERLVDGLHIFRTLGDRAAFPTALEGFAGLAVAEGQPERAVRLAAAAAVQREAIGQFLPPAERRDLAHRMAPARAALSETGYEARSAEGRVMNAQDAVAYALEPA